MDEVSLADVETHVFEVAEEDEVAGFELGSWDGCAVVVLRGGVVGQLDPELCEHDERETGAVEAVVGVGASPRVWGAEVADRRRYGALAGGLCWRRCEGALQLAAHA